MKFVAVAVLGLTVIALSAQAGTFKSEAGTFRTDPGTFGSHPKAPSMAPPRPPAPPAAPGYRAPSADDGRFKPWKPSVRVDSTRGGVDAYPSPKKPKGYVGPY